MAGMSAIVPGRKWYPFGRDMISVEEQYLAMVCLFWGAVDRGYVVVLGG